MVSLELNNMKNMTCKDCLYFNDFAHYNISDKKNFGFCSKKYLYFHKNNKEHAKNPCRYFNKK